MSEKELTIEDAMNFLNESGVKVFTQEALGKAISAERAKAKESIAKEYEDKLAAEAASKADLEKQLLDMKKSGMSETELLAAQLEETKKERDDLLKVKSQTLQELETEKKTRLELYNHVQETKRDRQILDLLGSKTSDPGLLIRELTYHLPGLSIGEGDKVVLKEGDKILSHEDTVAKINSTFDGLKYLHKPVAPGPGIRGSVGLPAADKNADPFKDPIMAAKIREMYKKDFG